MVDGEFIYTMEVKYSRGCPDNREDFYEIWALANGCGCFNAEKVNKTSWFDFRRLEDVASLLEKIGNLDSIRGIGFGKCEKSEYEKQKRVLPQLNKFINSE